MAQTTRRDDLQLLKILDQIDEWSMNGANGEVLRRFTSLRGAVTAAMAYPLVPRVVSAICLQPNESIVVFADQVARLYTAINDRKRWPLRDDRAANRPPFRP